MLGFAADLDELATLSRRARVELWRSARCCELDQQPGLLDGYGAIPAWQAIGIASDPSSTWRRLVLDDLTCRPAARPARGPAPALFEGLLDEA